jgi:uncharacterized damage-inducible protein DinB
MKEQILRTLQNSKKYTLDVAAAMPSSSYHFKPAEAIWNFNELLHHIGYGLHWWKDNFVMNKKTEWNPPAVTSTPEQTIQYLKSAFEDLEETLRTIKLTDTTAHGFYTTIDHVTHHRGQATTYLRAKGITPPEYVY